MSEFPITGLVEFAVVIFTGGVAVGMILSRLADTAADIIVAWVDRRR